MILYYWWLVLLIIRRSNWCTICSSRSIWMISLTLYKSVINCFLILNMSRGWKMTISLSVISLCLNIILSIFLLCRVINCICLACSSMSVYLLFVNHFQFLGVFQVSICSWYRNIWIIYYCLSSVRWTIKSILGYLVFSSIRWTALEVIFSILCT